MEKPEEISSSKMFGGYNRRFKHFSPTLGCSMTFSIYFPPTLPSQKIPVLYWLSGLTCTDENFIMKSGAQRAASAEMIALVAPDTSPRGLNIDGEADSWDFGVGAGFYLNATEEKWKNWRMYDYVVKELPKLLDENFKQLDTSKASIFGHSMGGHGALTIFLKNLDKYKAFSVCLFTYCESNKLPWGQKAFSNYLGGDKLDWEVYDATCLIAKYNNFSSQILIDQVNPITKFKETSAMSRCISSSSSITASLSPSSQLPRLTDGENLNSSVLTLCPGCSSHHSEVQSLNPLSTSISHAVSFSVSLLKFPRIPSYRLSFGLKRLPDASPWELGKWWSSCTSLLNYCLLPPPLSKSWILFKCNRKKWKNWRMYDYVVKELPKLLDEISNSLTLQIPPYLGIQWLGMEPNNFFEESRQIIRHTDPRTSGPVAESSFTRRSSVGPGRRGYRLLAGRLVEAERLCVCVGSNPSAVEVEGRSVCEAVPLRLATGKAEQRVAEHLSGAHSATTP
ncbi:hypothetical protein KFK09_000879 [Dendrobium nobile]|uniref:S-formylglutathione hydrolase n=1 Tax=Dendrobium nobile TaxID=94219 RepID=A0A8T3CCB0_DENNO|nr:hypothetical protein KFK09_000879 [Dendrobium nobile]